MGKPAAPHLLRVAERIGGGAWRSFHFSGLVDAGHMSGDPKRPMVHTDCDWATREHVDALWRAALALDLKALAQRYPQGKEAQSLPRHISLDFADPDGTVHGYQFPMDAPELSKVRELLSKEHYGHW